MKFSEKKSEKAVTATKAIIYSIIGGIIAIPVYNYIVMVEKIKDLKKKRHRLDR